MKRWLETWLRVMHKRLLFGKSEDMHEIKVFDDRVGPERRGDKYVWK